MSRFFRPLFLTFGTVLLVLTVVRAVQPARATGFYVTIYGSDTSEECCNVYMLHPGSRIAHRVRLKLASVAETGSATSPSGFWTTSYVRIPGKTGMYLLEEGTPTPKMIPLPNLVAQSQIVRWGLLEDTLYYLEHDTGGLESALFAISPPNPVTLDDLPTPTPNPIPPTPTPTPPPTLIPPGPPNPSLAFPPPVSRTTLPASPYAQPVRLTPYMFRYVHALNEYTLPETDYSPFGLLFWNANFLFVMSALTYQTAKKK